MSNDITRGWFRVVPGDMADIMSDDMIDPDIRIYNTYVNLDACSTIWVWYDPQAGEEAWRISVMDSNGYRHVLDCSFNDKDEAYKALKELVDPRVPTWYIHTEFGNSGSSSSSRSFGKPPQ